MYGLSLAVQPDAASGLAAQAVGWVGIVQVEGVRAVFHEVQLLGDLARDEVYAFRGLEVAFLLLVAFYAAVDAVELTDNGRHTGFCLYLEEELARFVRREDEVRRIGREAGRPVGKGGRGDEQGKEYGEGAEQEEPLRMGLRETAENMASIGELF